MNFHIGLIFFFLFLAKSFKKIVNIILTTHGSRGLAADMNDVEANSRQNSTISHFSRKQVNLLCNSLGRYIHCN